MVPSRRNPAVTLGRGLAGTCLALGAVTGQTATPYDCLIEPVREVAIRSPVDGLIDRVHVQRGDRVEAGDLLVELESSSERSTLELAKYRARMTGRIVSAQKRLDYARKKLQRILDLHEQSFISGQARDEAETEKLLAESELQDVLENRELAKLESRRAQALLDLRSLHSPLTGVVVDRQLNPGELAESGTGGSSILKLAQIDPLVVKVALPLEFYGKVQVDMTGEVLPEILQQTYPAVVTVVDSVFDAASGTFSVRLELPNPGGQLPAGIRCQVSFPEAAVAGNGAPS